MPFNTMLLTCLHQGTSFKEAGCEVRLSRKAGETTLFFVIDEQSNPKSLFRKNLQISDSLCDLVVFYACGDKQIVCLVELKGSDVKKAVQQVVNTKKSIKLQRSLVGQVEWKACIVLHGSAPKRFKQFKRELDQVFGRGNCQIARDSDLGNFLRG